MANIGRPLKLKTPEDLEKRIEAYFNYCDSRTRIKHLATKDGIHEVVEQWPRPYTIEGLAVFLDTNRQTLLNYNEKEFVNVGFGDEITIKDLALLIQKIVGFEGTLEFDSSKPNGTPRKLMDSSRLFSTGWKPSVGLEEGIQLAYADFLEKNSQNL